MSMSDHIKRQVLQEFSPKGSHSPGKRKNWILLFYQSGRTSTHIENILPAWSRGSVAHCFNLLHNLWYRKPKEQPQIGDRGSNPVAVNQFLIFFSLLGPHVLILHFHLLIFFILRGFLYLI